MLEQVWKNVAGDRFIATVEGNMVRLTIPRGSEITINDFGAFVLRLEDALDAEASFRGGFDEDGLVRIAIYFNQRIKKEEVEKEKPQESELVEEVPAKKNTKKVQKVEPVQETSEEGQ